MILAGCGGKLDRNMGKELYILTDGDGDFLVSMADLVHFTSMDVPKMRSLFTAAGFAVAAVPLDAIEAGGGSLRCCIGEIF